MELHEAWATLEIEPPADETLVRAAYRRLVRSTHPDLNQDTDATRRTIELTRAYAIVRAAQRCHPTAAPSGSQSAAATSSLAVRRIAEDAIGIFAPRDDAFRFVVDEVVSLGEITYLDRGSGLVEILVEFEQHGACQVVLALRDGAGAVTELSVTVESYHPHPPPTIGEVTRIVVDALSGAL
ncbi:MAG: Curved DNA-binding protein [Acidimicrobiales bacterium]|nr:MAG: hypothetical protein EDR02_06930 [Actinomycetota bacterium]MBV6508237.1 Curved DNA-binding protein [Acidimicrobiales bacterium]RIK07310.1 MAG: hypothetical protein DCC48_04320 [Acidobacteriota bacterium]